MDEFLPGEGPVPDEELENMRQRALDEIHSWIRDGLLSEEETRAVLKALKGGREK